MCFLKKQSLLLTALLMAAAITIGIPEAKAKDVTLPGATTNGENKNILVTYALNATDKIARVKKVVDNNFNQKKSCVIPSKIKVDDVTYTVSKIGAGAFASANNKGEWTDNKLSFTKIVLPNTIVEIGDEAFCYMLCVEECVIPSKVQTIGKYAFYQNRLTSATIPATCTSVGEGAFASNPIETLSFAEGTSPLTLGNSAFSNNDIKTLVTPKRLAQWGYSCFFRQNKLTEVTINGSVNSIPDNCFQECGNLTKVTVNAPIASINSEAFFNCYALSDFRINSVNTLRSIGYYAFQNCAFTSLGPELLPYGLNTIGESAFHSCSKIQSVEFPITLMKLVNNAFTNCKNISKIKCNTLAVPDTEDPTFDRSIYRTCDVEVFESLAPKFMTAPVWENFDWTKYASVDDIEVADDKTLPAEYYTTYGTRIDSGCLTPGIYIERRGTQTRKIAIK